MSKTTRDYAVECQRLEQQLFETNRQLRKTTTELNDLQMTCGFYRNAFKQNQDNRKEFIKATKEEWEPMLIMGNSPQRFG